MNTQDNLATVRGIYEAFGTGDVETILAAVADDVDWSVDAEPVAPWYGPRKGKDGVASFFADLAGTKKASGSLYTSANAVSSMTSTRRTPDSHFET